MSSLSMSLLLLALVAIAIVAGYNYWLGRNRVGRSKGPSVRESASTPPAAGRSEPTLGLDRAAGPDGPDAAAAMAPAARAPAQPMLDGRTDCIVELALPSLVSGERLNALASGFRRAGGKPVLVEAARMSPPPAFDDEVDGEPQSPGPAPDPAAAPYWQVPAAGSQFDLVRVGVLLANRNGPLNAMEFSDFVAGVQALADQLSVLVDTPEMGAVLARARELDEVCASLDAQLGIGVDSPEPLGVADLARLAGETACVERGNNRYARLGPAGEVLFSLALADAPNRLSLLLDVPRAPAAQSPWTEMVACARLCAQRLGGRVVDDAGRPLADAELDRIGQQVAARQERLALIGIDAGSPLALRLF
ncbi:MAG TPA: cell division protein ZipA C-terminal FtsZ-binding domain-containing protein, partial [Quisquiliibacterium sp.]|nr:cell division protein ZipA C-terminal FtsZ-binding domain-containing protein [Quisquiliibacterium sp.]